MKSIPQFLKKYFWDVDFSKLDKKNHSRFIIERILEYGDQGAVKWMKENFKLAKIKKIIYRSKNLSLRSANFWRFIFNLNFMPKKSFGEKQKNNIAILKRAGILANFYLAGGAGLALQLGHRLSLDLDFFTKKISTEKDIDTKILIQKLKI